MKRLHYSWVILTTSTILLGAFSLLIYSSGVFLVPIVTEFHWERAALSGAFSLIMLVGGILGFVTGKLCDKYGPRPFLSICGILIGIACLLMSRISSLWQVYLIWGILLSIAQSCILVPILSTVIRWFIKRKGLAMGLTIAGFSIGGIVSPLLTQWLISGYGWRQAYIVLGLIISIIIISLAQLMKHSPQRIGLKPYGEIESMSVAQSLTSSREGLTLKQAIKAKSFWLLGVILFFFNISLGGIMGHGIAHAISIGIPAAIAAGLLSTVAGSGAVSKFTLGIISDRIGTRMALTIGLVALALGQVGILLSDNVVMLYLSFAVYGIGYGGIASQQNLIPSELFGVKSIGVIIAAVTLTGTVGGAVGGPFAGFVFDTTGKYTLALVIVAILCTIDLILGLILLHNTGRGGKVDQYSRGRG